MAHAILGIRLPAEETGRGSDSQDRMDQIVKVAEKGKENVDG